MDENFTENINTLMKLAHDIGFEHYGEADISAFVPDPRIREMCAADKCRKYAHSWSCPPASGSIVDCKKLISGFSGGVIVQTTMQLEDSFDYDGMKKCEQLHKQHFDTFVRQANALINTGTGKIPLLPMSAGTCTRCHKCTYPDKPCRHPEKLYISMEAYGLFVSDVCAKSKMGYKYGDNSITYTSCILI